MTDTPGPGDGPETVQELGRKITALTDGWLHTSDFSREFAAKIVPSTVKALIAKRDRVLLEIIHDLIATGAASTGNDVWTLRRSGTALRSLGVTGLRERMTAESLAAYRRIEAVLIETGTNAAMDAALMAMAHPEDADLIEAAVRERAIDSWDGLNAVLPSMRSVHRPLSVGAL